MSRNDGPPATDEHRDVDPPTAKYEPGRPDNVANRLGFRRWLDQRPTLKHSYRVGVGIVGVLVVVLGLALVPLPGPGWLVVIAGLAILATEFEWAARLLRFTRRHVKSWTDWVARQALWVRLVIGVLVLAFVYGVLVVTLHVTGVPGWVPTWVPLWR